MRARGTAEVSSWPSIIPSVHVLASAPTDVSCAPHARPNTPKMYCLLTQETQKKAKAAKKLFYGRSRRHHADSDGSGGEDSDGSG